MEAPIPASALIHSATLVSLGIFILIKFYFIILFKIHIIKCIGIITSIYGGITAIFQSDLKKILAYSTISNSGILIILASYEFINLCFLYLLIHGFFKALSFLSLGFLIKNNNNIQDIKKYGQFLKFFSINYYILFFSLINLSGLPLFFGFFTKHNIFIYFSKYVEFFFFFNSFISFIYCYKIFFFIFYSFKKFNKSLLLKNKNVYSINLFLYQKLFIYLLYFFFVYYILFQYYYSFI